MVALREVVSELLEGEGAVVDAVEPDGLDVMAPAALAARFGWPEYVRLAFGALPAAGTVRIGLEDDWLDRLGGLLADRGRLAECQLPRPDGIGAPNDPQRLIDGVMSLPNAVWRLKGVEPEWARVILLAFRYMAVSDEQRDGIVWLGFNTSTGASLDGGTVAALRHRHADGEAWLPPSEEASLRAGPVWDPQTIAARARPCLERAVRDDIEPFLAAMRRRLERDRLRIHAYHDDLRQAAFLKLAALERGLAAKISPKSRSKARQQEAAAGQEKAAAAMEREKLRIATIEREYKAKLDDLRHNYALSVSVEWVQALVLLAPVWRHELSIRRRKGERTLALDWHATVRRMEPAPCDLGDAAGIERHVCDDRLHLTTAAGQAPCPGCGKAFCRACHVARCPKCGRAAAV